MRISESEEKEIGISIFLDTGVSAENILEIIEDIGLLKMD